MTIFIIRHPQTLYNIQHRYQGLSNSPISSEGLLTVNDSIASLSKAKIRLVVSSPLERCLTIANYIGKKLNTTVTIDDRLKEICYGSWEGMTKEQVMEQFDTNERKKNRFTFKHPGIYEGVKGESYLDLYNRLIPFWKELKTSKLGNQLVVGHMGVMIAAKKYFENLSDQEAANFRTPNSTILKYEII